MRKDQNVELPRSAGVLLHPTSLPSGKLDRDAYRFVDWLEAAGQSWWQVLPLGPPDEFGSPYRSPSAFAASPQLLARPEARVTAGEVEDFVARHPFWAGGWADSPAGEALADEVRFEREWGSCGPTRPSAASASSATCRSTSPKAAPITIAGRSCSPAARSPARRPTR